VVVTFRYGHDAEVWEPPHDQTVEHLTDAVVSPLDITRLFITLRDKGRLNRDWINAFTLEERKRTRFGAEELAGWLTECGEAILKYRPGRTPEFEAASTFVPRHDVEVVTRTTAALDLSQERLGRIDRALAVVDSIIATDA